MLSKNPSYQIVKAHQRRGYRVNRWDGRGWVRASDVVFSTVGEAESWIDSAKDND